MPWSSLFVLALAAAIVAGCAPPTRYPISGEACAPDDAVQGMSPIDCPPF